MYDDHYGLSGRPFQLTPDPRFWFDTATHRKAMAYLGYGLSQGEGFIVITGDVGAGKTTLVGHLMATVDRERLHVIKIVSTQIEPEDLLRLVADGLGVDTRGLAKSQLLSAIERGLHATARAGRRTLLIVDEAQALPVGSLEELRMLSNFQAGGHALLQIFLLGQPEFRERLHGSERLEQLRQRVIAMHHLDPMGSEEVAPYMTHRLSLVGWQGDPHFTPDAYRALHDGSGGVPRRLNHLAGRVMLFGAIEQLATIDGRVVDAVIADIAGDVPVAARPAEAPRAEPLAAAPLAAAPLPAEALPAEPAAPVDRAGAAILQAPVQPQIPPQIPSAPARPQVRAAPIQPEPVQHEPEPIPHRPLPIVNAPPPSAPLPMRAVRDIAPPAPIDPVFEPRSQAQPHPEPQLQPEPQRQPTAETPAAAPDSAQADRIASLEARVEEQEAAMRRILTLMVDWVEGGAAADAAPPHAAGGR